jgi:NAD(P)-dependent dehydrogenase (short-subunit alcohol dehydrogenase family)
VRARAGTALVTGASSGIGAATCRRLREGGWHVAGVARGDSPEASASVRADVTRFPEVEAALAGVPDLRLLVHCAATIHPVAPLAESDPGAWRWAVEVNLLGTSNVLRAALAGPLGSNGGLAIHLTSGAAAHAKPHWSAYSASKAGAEHLMRSVAADVEGTGVAVCALDPGITETPMQEQLRALDFPGRERFVQVYEQRAGRAPEEVADAVWELSLRDPRTLNGLTLRVGSL